MKTREIWIASITLLSAALAFAGVPTTINYGHNLNNHGVYGFTDSAAGYGVYCFLSTNATPT
jgi:hypothetical protein